VLYNHLGHAAALDLLEQLDGRVGVVTAHAGGGFVEEQQARVLDEAHGQFHAPLVAAAEAAGEHIAACDHANVLEHVLGFGADAGFAVERAQHVELEHAVALGQRGDHHVMEDGQVSEDFRRLEDTGNAELIDLEGLSPGQHGTVEHHLAA